MGFKDSPRKACRPERGRFSLMKWAASLRPLPPNLQVDIERLGFNWQDGLDSILGSVPSRGNDCQLPLAIA
jgi:hypothetical protein